MSKAWPIATVALGAATLGIVLGFSFLPEVRAAYPNGDFGAALSDFQRASTPADLASVFGDPANPGVVAAMQAGNKLDLYDFIPAYATFLIMAAFMLAGGARKPIALLSILPALAGAGADVVETWTQLRMTSDMANADALLPLAPWCWAKYFGLAVSALGATAICFLGDRKRWIIGMLGFVPFAVVFADWAGAFTLPTLMSFGFGFYWIALIIVGVMEIFRPARAA